MPTPRRAHVLVALASVLAALGTLAVPPGAGAAGAGSPPSSTVWLCRPGQVPDPCTASLSATVVRADGTRSVERDRDAADPPIDCFYVYPTVSTQPTENANLDVDPTETAVAVEQASRFSQVCRVYAPIYPQLTLQAITRAVPASAAAIAYAGVASAWEDYLAHDNHGRGVVVIGHSQGASLLIALLERTVDADPALRRHLVSAILLGGNVLVPDGKTEGATFAHIPACRSAAESGCVVAYSSFSSTPPSDSYFGRVPAGDPPGLHVLCTDPAALGGGTGVLQPYLTTAGSATLGHQDRAPLGVRVTTPWVTYPDRYAARCTSAGGATWLAVDALGGAADRRPVVAERLGPRWGLHLVDVNLALGNLVALVRAEAAAYRR